MPSVMNCRSLASAAPMAAFVFSHSTFSVCWRPNAVFSCLLYSPCTRAPDSTTALRSAWAFCAWLILLALVPAAFAHRS